MWTKKGPWIANCCRMILTHIDHQRGQDDAARAMLAEAEASKTPLLAGEWVQLRRALAAK